MDIGLSSDIRDSFRLFQARIMQEYDAMIDEFGLTVIDGTRSIEEQQATVRRIVAERLKNYTGVIGEKRKAKIDAQ